MYIYLSIYLFNIIFNISPKNNKVTAFLFITLLVFILGARGVDVGVDTSHYYSSFNAINGGYYELKDYLYFLIAKLIIFLGFGPEMMIFVFSLLTILPLSYVIHKDSPYPIISYAILLAFGFYAFYFNGMRQGAAMSFGFLSFYFLMHNNKKETYLSLLIATLLHASAIILLPIFFIFKASKLTRFYILILLWPISILSTYNSSIFISILNTLSFLVPSRFLIYIQPGELKDTGMSFVFNQVAFIILFYIFFKMKESISSRYVYLALLGIVLLYLFSGVKYVDRLALYYFLFSIIAIPIAISNVKGIKSKLSIIIMLLFVLFIQFFFRATVDPHFIFPYYTIFDQ